jgi:hypothetical protein
MEEKKSTYLIICHTDIKFPKHFIRQSDIITGSSIFVSVVVNNNILSHYFIIEALDNIISLFHVRSLYIETIIITIFFGW